MKRDTHREKTFIPIQLHGQTKEQPHIEILLTSTNEVFLTIPLFCDALEKVVDFFTVTVSIAETTLE